MGCILGKKSKSLYLDNSSNHKNDNSLLYFRMSCEDINCEVIGLLGIIKVSDVCNRIDIIKNSNVVQTFDGPFTDRDILKINSFD